MEIARHWRTQDIRYQLIGEQCGQCDEYIFPPRDVCPHCGAGKPCSHQTSQDKPVHKTYPVEFYPEQSGVVIFHPIQDNPKQAPKPDSLEK